MAVLHSKFNMIRSLAILEALTKLDTRSKNSGGWFTAPLSRSTKQRAVAVKRLRHRHR